MSSISVLSRTLSCNETAELGFEPGAVGCEARTLSIVLCGILHIICMHLKKIGNFFLLQISFYFLEGVYVFIFMVRGFKAARNARQGEGLRNIKAKKYEKLKLLNYPKHRFYPLTQLL